MVDLEVLEEKGVSAEKWKEILSKADANGATPTNKGIADLRGLIRSRINEGRESNTGNYRIFQALDSAWDCSYQQVTPTMLKTLIDSNMDVNSMADALKTWGVNVSEVLEEYQDPKTNLTLKRYNMPAFFRIFVRLVGPYVTIRRAKMMNDRKLVPFMKVEPAISNEETRMRCEIITSRMQEMADQYGFWEVEDQACFRFLHYGICLRFICEEWHKEKALVDVDSPYLSDEDDEYGEGEKAEVGPMTTTAESDKPPTAAEKKKFKCVIMKEGLRYHMPHPSRMFYDMAWPTHTLNTDSGATYAGYWRVMRYGEILNKKAFFNLGAISIGNMQQWINSNKAFFDAVYPCSLQFPSCAASAGEGVGALDTEKKIGEAFYVTDDKDKGIIITEYFMKFIPSEYGLGDYDYPIWARFVIANNDTIIYAAPLPYSSPVLFDGYDPVSGRSLYNSMSLEILPHQDHYSNLYSQYLLSVKSNLTNMTLVDEDQVNAEDIGFLRKAGQMMWTGLNFIRFSRRKNFKAQQDQQVTFPQRFPQVDVASIAQAMRTQLDIVERLLGISPQELGQAASHEQTREEVKNIAVSTSTRAEFTSGSLDRSKQAWKKQIYEGLMAYGSDEGYAQVPYDPAIGPEELSKLGFTWEDSGDPTKKRLGRDKKITVRYAKTAIKYTSFAANRDVNDRINDVELARAMGNFMMQMLGNQMTGEAIGPDQAIAMANLIGQSAGFPRDFKLYNRGKDATPQENNQEMMTQLQQILQQAMEQLKQEMTQDVQGALQQVIETNDEQSKQIQEIAQEVVRLAKGVMSNGQDEPIPMPGQDLPPPQAISPAMMAQ